MADHERQGHPDGAVAVVRRAPFSDNPRVGARGQRTQQRILDAALRAFGEAGYHGCSIDQITKLARCSRVSFYQYFANKEDVFRQLAGQVARQVGASTEALDPLTPDLAGWITLRAWVARFAEIHLRYEPVFHAFEGDEELAVVARQTGEESVTRIRARLEATTLPPRHRDPVLRLLLECLNRTLDITAMVRSVRTDVYPGAGIEVALTDVMHRTLFGIYDNVNVHAPESERPPALESGSEMFELVQPPGAIASNSPTSRVLDALLESGRDVFVERGFHSTRVEDLVAAAGVSHGAFYRYFRNKEELARMLTARAVEAVGTTVNEIPDVATLDEAAGRGVMRRWLSRYHVAHMNEARMMRVWLDAALQGPQLRTESAPIFDWGRRRMARWLSPRGFGDVDMDAVVLVALLSVFGARQRSAPEVEAAVLVVERGLLGRSS